MKAKGSCSLDHKAHVDVNCKGNECKFQIDPMVKIRSCFGREFDVNIDIVLVLRWKHKNHKVDKRTNVE